MVWRLGHQPGGIGSPAVFLSIEVPLRLIASSSAPCRPDHTVGILQQGVLGESGAEGGLRRSLASKLGFPLGR